MAKNFQFMFVHPVHIYLYIYVNIKENMFYIDMSIIIITRLFEERRFKIDDVYNVNIFEFFPRNINKFISIKTKQDVVYLNHVFRFSVFPFFYVTFT